jgi:hypothetical protein
MHRLFFVIILLLATNSFAAEVANLYQAQVPVSTQTEQERQQLAPEILRKVILKVVGDRAALDIADLSPVLSRANELVQQFQYQRLNEISEDLTQPDRLALILTFNQSALAQALNESSLPIWSSSRPDVLIWLTLDEYVIGAQSQRADITERLYAAAEQRGLPILLPLMDLQDQAQVRAADVRGGYVDNVAIASQRYGAAVVLTANMAIENGQAHINWQTELNGQTEVWHSRGDVAVAINAGIEELTDRVSRRFTQVVSNPNSYQYDLEISDVTGFADYSRVMDYLKKAQYVTDVNLVKLSADSLFMRISLQGDLDVFKQALSIERVLAADTFYSDDDVLRYRLLP